MPELEGQRCSLVPMTVGRSVALRLAILLNSGYLAKLDGLGEKKTTKKKTKKTRAITEMLLRGTSE